MRNDVVAPSSSARSPLVERLVGFGAVVQQVNTTELFGCQVVTASLGPLWAVYPHLAQSREIAAETAGIVGTSVGMPGSSSSDLANVAVAEAVERYTVVGWPEGSFSRPPAAGRERFVRTVLNVTAKTAAAQVPGQVQVPRLSRSDGGQWVRGVDLTAHEHVWVPADAVYVYPPPGTAQVTGMPRTSSGVAVHVSDAAAIENAVLELIERDIVSRTWSLRQSMPVLAAAELETAAWLHAELAAAGLMCSLHHSELVPGLHTVMAVGRADGVVRRTVLGAATSWSIDGGAVKAMLECVGLLHALRRNPLEADPSVGGALLGARQLAHADWAWAFHFLHEVSTDVAMASSRRDTATGNAVDLLRELDMTVVAVPLQSEALSISGLAGWRVIVPQLHPLVFGHWPPRPAWPPFENASASAGLNRLPNPFG